MSIAVARKLSVTLLGLALCAAGPALVGCSGDAGSVDRPEDGPDDSFFTDDMKSDLFGIAENTPLALAILSIANTADVVTLYQDVTVSQRTAEYIVEARTLNGNFQQLSEFDSVQYVGPICFRRLRDYVIAQGLVPDAAPTAMDAGARDSGAVDATRTDAARLDGGTTDASRTDAARLDGGSPDAMGVTGTPVILSEVLYNPTGADDGNEWVEVLNVSTRSIDLTGWTVASGGARFATSARLTGSLAPGQCALIGGPAGGQTFFQTVNFSPDLQNGGAATDGVALLDPAGRIIDAVLYDGPNTALLEDESGDPGSIDVMGATDGQSVERTGSTWRVQAMPTPGNCASAR
jgi:hypothetical protein